MEKTTLAHKSDVKRSNWQPPANSQIRQHSSHSSCGGCGACHKIARITSTNTNASASLMLKSLDPGKKICATRFLQRTYGNQYVQRLIQTKMDSPCIQRCGSRTIQMKASGCCGGCANHGKEEEGVQMQAKLTIGQPGDKYEQEADRVADTVMRMPEPQVQRQPIEEEEEALQMKDVSGSTPDVSPDLGTRLNTSKGGGQPLPETDRSFMETRFGSDFSGVRVHTNGDAVQMNRELNAAAFTHGRDIYFGAGRYSPGASSGKRLLAHELTHVVQQGSEGIHFNQRSGKRCLSPFANTIQRQESGIDIDEDRDGPSSTLSATSATAATARADITLETGNIGAGFLNNLLHQQICIDGHSRDGKRCFSFAATGAQLPQFSKTWLGWNSWVTGAILKGEVYQPRPVPGATVVSRHTPTVTQGDTWLRYMGTRLGLQDGYSVGRHNCRLYSQWEFRDAPRHW